MGSPGVRRTEHGFEIHLPLDEHRVLTELPEGLRAILRGEARPDLRARLFPRGSDDPQINQEYRDLVGEELLRSRLAAVERFAATLEAGQAHRRMWRIRLDDDEAHAWLSAVNDFRLILASLADVTSEDAWEAGPDYDRPESVLLFHLSWLQEELLAALMSGLPAGDM